MSDASQEADRRPRLNNSHFHMWRCLVAIIMSDGVYHPAERKFVDKAFAALDQSYNVTNEQKMTFFDDLKNPKDVDKILAQVTDPLHRALIPWFGQFITMIDGRKDPREKAFVHSLQVKVKNADTDNVAAELEAAINERKAQSTRFFNLIDFLLERVGIGPLG
jgi:hypothetical protein